MSSKIKHKMPDVALLQFIKMFKDYHPNKMGNTTVFYVIIKNRPFGITNNHGMSNMHEIRGKTSLYPDFPGEQHSEQPIQLLQDDTGIGGRHKPIAVTWVAAQCTRGTGATTLTASDRKSFGPKANRSTPDVTPK